MKAKRRATSSRKASPGKDIVNGKVLPPRRQKNEARRPREYLTPPEVERLLDAARAAGRHGKRDYALLRICYDHGLRVSELVALRWDQVSIKPRTVATLSVRRLKGGDPSVQYPGKKGKAALKALAGSGGEFVFANERDGGPLSTSAVRKIVARAGEAAGLVNVHPHMLRHSIGFKLVNDGRPLAEMAAYLGHRSMQSTMLYAKVNHTRFRGWID